LERKQPRSFIDEIRSGRRDLILDWGFPPNCLPFVRNLVGAGFSHWWFDGDREAAHESFLSRCDHPGSEDAWQIQLERIEQSWEQLAAVFSGRIIDVISNGPTYLSNLERLRAMQDRGLRASDSGPTT